MEEIIKQKQDIILLIMNCKKYRNKALFQKHGWLQFIPSYIKYYHVIGDINLTSNYVINEEEHILYVYCEDDYINLPKKVIRAYNAIDTVYDYRYIYKTDDDQNVTNIDFFNKITSILTSTEKETIHYGGNILTIKLPQLSMYNICHSELPNNIVLKPTKYSNGRFYLLSKSSVKNLLKKKESIEKEYFEDYAIGYYLDSKLKEFMLFLSSDTYFKDINESSEEWQTFLSKKIMKY